MVQVKDIGTGYVPRDWQLDTHMELFGTVTSEAVRHAILVFHRRGGKSVFAVNHIITAAIRFDKMCPLTGKPLMNPHFGFVAPTRAQVENIAWGYFQDYMRDIPGVKFNQTKLKATFPHPRGTCTISLFGAENFDNMRGIYLDGYALDEFADMHPDVRDKVLLPTLSDRLGWEMVIGTPKGENAFKRLYDVALNNSDTWYHRLTRASESGILSKGELNLLKQSMSEEAYRQEYECDFNAAPSGKYYQKYMDDARLDGRIGPVPYDPVSLVTTYWDLGFNDSTAIWFVQEVGREIRVLEYFECHGKGLDWIVPNVILNKKYNYREHVVPHDANHHELSTGTTRVEFMRTYGLENIRVLEKSKNVAEDVHAVRLILPKCWFNVKECDLGIRALASYERKWDAREKVYSNNPRHNWASHGADAFRYFALDYKPGMGTALERFYEESSIDNSPDYDILDF